MIYAYKIYRLYIMLELCKMWENLQFDSIVIYSQYWLELYIE